ncbi:excinuclease ABC subunit UvrC, partial [Nonomuraea dietziae]|uniref:excinuclease ABC subunit UvrC n=2 Tax=Streptosporangiaceae TaxID=2004 RepID=UPI003412C29F
MDVASTLSFRPKPGSIPDSPGVYRFRDANARVIYVGKAKSLRQRLNSYFADFAGLHPRTQTMLTTAAGVDWTVVGTEVEALQLEYSWIKEFDPRFNVKYRDDKSYPYLAVTMGEEFPRVQVLRGAKKKGTRYFGPYSHAWAIRETVDLLLRVFPVRTCSAGVFKRAGQIGRPCLLGYIDKCSAPCVGRVTPEEHRDLAEDFCDFMAGNTGRFIKRLEQDMREAAGQQEYERAARIRDDVQALQRALEKQAVVLGDATDADVVALAEDPLEAAIQVFYVRGGRIRGQRGWVVDKVEETTPGDLVEHFLLQIYSEGEIPKEVLVAAMPPDAEAVTELLSEQRGARVELRVPQRGDKKSLMETVERNAKESLAQHKIRRASDLTTRSKALQEIADALDLDQVPLRIECYDVSHLQGENVVASMVVFEDGLARKSEYRRFAVRTKEGDVASIHEVITRRFKRYLEEKSATGELAAEDDVHGPIDPETGRPRKFAYPPNLVVVDGAGPQAAAAQR